MVNELIENTESIEPGNNYQSAINYMKTISDDDYIGWGGINMSTSMIIVGCVQTWRIKEPARKDDCMETHQSDKPGCILNA